MNIAPGAYRYAVPPLFLAVTTSFFLPIVSGLLITLAVFVLVFHRDPSRTPPSSGVASPADGTVSVIRREDDGRLRVGVYMSVANVHVNRAPLDGTVRAVSHIPGANRPAFSKDSDRNERVHVEFDAYEVTLIAGAFARRIHPYVSEGDHLERGDRLGHISFGSRADVILPVGVERDDVLVDIGESVRAGETRLVAE